MNIYKKLMLSLVGLTGIILMATLLLARWSFEQGFNNFLHAQELERLNRISQEITSLAPNAKNINELEDRSLNRIVDIYSVAKRSRRAPPPRFEDRGSRPPPPHLLDRGNEDKHIYTGVFDLSGKQIAGDILDEEYAATLVSYELAIKTNQQTIGVLKSWENNKFESPTASEFSDQQITTSILIGVFSLFLAVVLSYFGAKRLLAPIKLIMQGVEDLSNGNYTYALANKREDEFGELINNVNHLGEVLEKTRSAKNRWFADISHELRTPLTVLMGELEALKMGIRPLSLDQVDSLMLEAQLLKRLIEDLYQLSVSDIGALRYEFADVDLSALLIRIVEHSELSAKANNISLEKNIQQGIRFSCDENRINQLFTNLLNNSLAYTDNHGTINISLLLQKKQIQLSIQDSAPTLSDIECEQMFEPLFRHNKARTRNSGGAGLGLAISKNIVQAHGGNVVAKPSCLGGVEITVTFTISSSLGIKAQQAYKVQKVEK